MNETHRAVSLLIGRLGLLQASAARSLPTKVELRLKQPRWLPLFRGGMLVRHIQRDEYSVLIQRGEAKASANKARLLSIVLIDDHDESGLTADRPPKGRPTSFREHVGDYKVWRHAPACRSWPKNGTGVREAALNEVPKVCRMPHASHAETQAA